MIRSTFRCSLVAAGILAAGIGSAGPAKDARFALEGPHLYEANRRSSNLIVADLNGDGAMDIATTSNDESLLRILYRSSDKKAEDPFAKEEITLDRAVSDMIPADVNGDGRTDLIVAGPPARLAVMYQTDDGRLQKGTTTSLDAEIVALGDVTNDDLDDVLLVNGQQIAILPSKARGISLDPLAPIFATTTLGTRPMIADIDGDGRNDIVYQPAENREKVIVRFQSPEGDFPAEVWLDTGLLRTVRTVPVAKERALLAAIQGKTRHLVMLGLAEPLDDSSVKDADVVFGDPRLVGFDPKRWDEKAFSVVADVDGDGRQDLLVATPKSASVRLLRQTRTGSLKPEEVPSLKDLRAIVPWPVEEGKPAPLLLLSGEEKAIGLARVEEKNRETLKFPQPLPLATRPLALAVAPIGEAKQHSLLVIEELGPKKFALNEYAGFDPAQTTLPAAKLLFAFKEGGEAPQSLSAQDVNADGRPDLVVFFEFETPMVLLQDKDGRFAPVESSGILAGLLKSATPSRLRPAMLEGAKTPEMLVVKDEYARAFHLDEKSQVAIRQQFNGDNTRARLRVAVTGSFRDKKSRDVAVLDSGNRTLLVFAWGEDGQSYAKTAELALDGADYQAMEALDLDGDGKDDIVMIAPDRATIVYTHVLNGAFETLDSAESPVEEGAYGGLATLPLVDGAPPAIAGVEMRENMLEMFTLTARSDSAKLSPFYKFRVYDSESSMAQRVNVDAPPEPRELETADLNGDGKPDLVALVHNYVIVYYQK